MPPSEAPIATGLAAVLARHLAGDRGRVGGKVREGVGASCHPLAVAMAALVEGDRVPALLGEPAGRLRPGVARLSAAVQEEDRAPGLPHLAGDEPVAVRAEKRPAHRSTVRPLGEEGQDALLVHLVADGEVMVPARECRAPWRWASDRGKLLRRTRRRYRASRPRRGSATAIEATSSSVSVWRDPRMQAASALRSLFVCSAKARNMRCIGIGQFVERGRLHGVRDAQRQADPVTRLDRRARRGAASDPRRVDEREMRRDPRAHRIAHDVGARDAEMVEKPARIPGHDRRNCSPPGGRAFRFGHGRDCRARSPGSRRGSASSPTGYSTQLTAWFEAKPWMSRIGSRAPVSGVTSMIGDADAARN